MAQISLTAIFHTNVIVCPCAKFHLPFQVGICRNILHIQAKSKWPPICRQRFWMRVIPWLSWTSFKVLDNTLVSVWVLAWGAKPLHICASLGLIVLTHWGRVTHICASKQTTIGSDNGLPPGQRQSIIWTYAGILLIGPLRTKFSESWSKFIHFHLKKMHLKMSSGNWRPFGLALNMLQRRWEHTGNTNITHRMYYLMRSPVIDYTFHIVDMIIKVTYIIS